MSASEDLPTGTQALVPVAHGWPLRTVSGNAVWKLLPERAQALARVLAVTPAVLASGVVLALIFRWSHGTMRLFFLPFKGLKIGYLAVAGAGLARLSGRLFGWQLRRVAAAHATSASLREARDGALVRVVGRVLATEPFTAALSGRPAVLCHYEVRGGGVAAQHEVRGIDFLLEIDEGEPLLVSVREAFLEDRPGKITAEPADASVLGARVGDGVEYREARLSPGDRIEALGVLTRQIDPTLSGGPERAPPLRMVVRAGAHVPLLLRHAPAVG
jgi:hypothetical protein